MSDLDRVSGLFGEVITAYDQAIEKGDAFFYPSDLDTSLGEPEDGVQWQVRICKALLKKDKAAPSKETGEKAAGAKQNSQDVFAPPYVPGLLVKELGDHVVLLNKFCVAPRHFLLVTRDFATQDLPPSPPQVALSYRILLEHFDSSRSRRDGPLTDLFAFYNCGQTSGASQPHRHVQFVEYESSSRDSGLPIETLLTRIEKDGKEYDHVHALPLPYQHFVVLLSPPPASDPAALEQYFAGRTMLLLDTLFRVKLAQDDSSAQNGRPARPAFNLLLSRTAMHLIPRREAEFVLPPSGKLQGGKLSINSMAFAGFLLVRSDDELSGLQQLDGGVRGVLSALGCPPVADVTVAQGAPDSAEPA